MGIVIRRLTEISRPVLWINTIGTTVVGMWLSGYLWTWEILPILLWVTLPFNLLIYGINDIYDQDTDAENDRKGGFGGAKIKPAEVRMGSGKGAPEYWVARVHPGRIMFEIEGVPEDVARHALELADAKLPIKTKFIARLGGEA